MHPEQVFVEFPPPPSPPPPPKGKPGRKRLDVPAERKVLLNREAQRACRDRRARYIQDLETENVGLKQRIQDLEIARQNSACPSCVILQSRNEEQAQRIKDLEDLVSGSFRHKATPILHAAHEPASRIDTFHESMDFETASDEWIDVQSAPIVPKSAIELYGPVDCEHTRQALNSLPSIKDNPNIDAMIDLFILQASTVDTKLCIKYLVGIITTRYKLLDACTLLDRHQALEIMDDFKQRNNNHSFNIYQFLATKKPGITTTISYKQAMIQLANPRIKPFRDALVSIPSLSGAETVIDELCLLFWSCTSLQRDREDRLLQLVLVARKLEHMCIGEEDRTKFHIATEIGREGNRSRMDELLDI
ncbi:UNVERIFIED_CONTAM: hypothetical protein HDU68_001711 [Siphonaria sp. JEL0065]|nr:hypothetical protein HDU68_001711 [Siphonaria sp. JEL0065]